MAKPQIIKHGTEDILLIETNPVVFKGRLYRFEYVNFDRCGKIGNTTRGNTEGCSYFRFLDVEAGTYSAPFGHRLHMGNAFVWQDHIVVTAVEDWGKSRFYQMESDDMVHWSEPRVILSNPLWEGYNTSICRDEQGFVLVFELGAPLDVVHEPFTMFFARSTDLKNWTQLPDAVFGQDIYTGGPMLRYFDGWYYFFFLDGSYEKGFKESVVRSHDLKKWEWGRHNPVLDFDQPGDKTIAGKFNAAELKKIADAVNINNSDMDMCDWQGKLYVTYSWGNQRGNEFLATAESPMCEKDFCKAFFE